MRALPSQGQSFRKIREDDLLYVDKTKYLFDIVNTEGCFFLSRPRRFGKSLLLGAAHELLRCHREYFKGLWIDSSDYDFIQYPVVRLDMTCSCESTDALITNISGKLRRVAERNGIGSLNDTTPDDMLSELVYALNRASGERVAVLIDEYDAPIQRVIGDLVQADKNRDTLFDFYSSLKSLADRDQTHLILVVGITKFAQSSLFSALNNLYDLTMDSSYNVICGFTLEEFEDYFSDYLPKVLEYNKSKGLLPESATVADLKEAILNKYDGYSWDGIDRILNPFSIVKTFAKRELHSYWYSTATPTIFLELLKRENILDFPENPEMNLSSLSSVDLANLELTPLMFQTGYGYLTVDKRIDANA